MVFLTCCWFWYTAGSCAKRDTAQPTLVCNQPLRKVISDVYVVSPWPNAGGEQNGAVKGAACHPKRSRVWRWLLALIGLALLAWIGYFTLAWPWLSRWGATAEEIQQPLPGDALAPALVTTKAITVQAPPEAIWPWLVQLGVDRGGMYSYLWVENWLLQLNVQNTEEIRPEWQQIAVGDFLRFTKMNENFYRTTFYELCSRYLSRWFTWNMERSYPTGKSDLAFVGKYHEKFAGLRWVIEFKYYSNAEFRKFDKSIETFELQAEDTEQIAGCAAGLRREYPQAQIAQYVIYCFGNQGFRVFRV